jgi:crossover junction endonuclease MUS81
MADEECANPLLLGWVKEWLETARERNTKGVTVYRKAYDSLKACPLAFQHPSEAQQLHGFGPKLCDRLTDKLKEHCQKNGLPMPDIPQKVKKTANKDDDGTAPAKPTRKPKPYVPKFLSGPYALILALSTLGENAQSGITKQRLIELAQPHCDSSFTASSDPGKFYTAWGSMKTLIEKEYVCEKGRPLRKYFLTDEGFEVAKRLKAARPVADPKQKTLDAVVPPANPRKEAFSAPDEDGFMAIDSSPIRSSRLAEPQALDTAQDDIQLDIVPFGGTVSDESSLPTFSPITVPPSAFTLELVLDVREIRAKEDRDYMRVELSKKGVTPIMRSLDLGDCLWVAKCKDPQFLPRHGLEGDEIMLDWIVERKRLDDLVGSIKDGRFHEQKFRLRKSGVKNVIYIIEEISMNADHFQKYEEAVESAIASSQVVNGYFIKKTQKMDDTIRYLTRMTMMLKELYESKPLKVIPTRVLTTQNYLPLLAQIAEKTPTVNCNITYPAFASLASKSETLTLRDVFLKMLMCTRGVTGEKALEIQRRWKTPQDLVMAFEACGGGEEGRKRKRELVSGYMENMVGRKKLAKKLSERIAEVWGDA